MVSKRHRLSNKKVSQSKAVGSLSVCTSTYKTILGDCNRLSKPISKHALTEKIGDICAFSKYALSYAARNMQSDVGARVLVDYVICKKGYTKDSFKYTRSHTFLSVIVFYIRKLAETREILSYNHL